MFSGFRNSYQSETSSFNRVAWPFHNPSNHWDKHNNENYRPWWIGKALKNVLELLIVLGLILQRDSWNLKHIEDMKITWYHWGPIISVLSRLAYSVCQEKLSCVGDFSCFGSCVQWRARKIPRLTAYHPQGTGSPLSSTRKCRCPFELPLFPRFSFLKSRKKIAGVAKDGTAYTSWLAILNTDLPFLWRATMELIKWMLFTWMAEQQTIDSNIETSTIFHCADTPGYW